MCQIIMHLSFTATMGKKGDLTSDEKSKIVQMLGNGETSNVIAKELGRDHRTIKRFIQNSQGGRKKRAEKPFRKLSGRDVNRIKREIVRRPLATSKDIFSGIGLGDIPRSTRCRVLRQVAKVKKSKKRPPLTQQHREKRVEWAKKYMKLDFSKVIFTDECRATLDGPDGWASGWIRDGHSAPTRKRRQQGGGGVMFWAAIIKDELVGPFRVENGVKINSETYCDFLKKNFLPWWKKVPAKVKKTLVFMQDNTSSHGSRYSREWLASRGFVDDRLMVWPAVSPDLNPIENFWSIIKNDLYKEGKQYCSLDELWKEIIDAAKRVDKDTINKLTSSVDKRLCSIIEKKGGYIGH